MFPKTLVIGAPSIRMRVGSLTERTASTDTPSLASTVCSAEATCGSTSHRAGISSANASLLVVLPIGDLLERLKVDAAARVLELDEERPNFGIANIGAVDQPAK